MVLGWVVLAPAVRSVPCCLRASIIRVFSTSSGVVAAAAIAPARLPKIALSVAETWPLLLTPLVLLPRAVRIPALRSEYDFLNCSHSVNCMIVNGISRMIVTPPPR